ncbi:hypothetical protein HDU97_008030, partial [Phlyctochytrium planicorne]
MFLQNPPSFGNQFDEDPFLKSILRRRLPGSVYNEIESDLSSFGQLVASPEIQEYSRDAQTNLPHVEQYDAWGKRVDRLHTTEGWKQMKRISAEHGLIAIAYERKYAEFSRLYQFSKLYLFAPACALYGCPLAMTDGAARVIELKGDSDMKNKAYKNLTSRDPKLFWTSGQWMTERPGGSDVGRTESNAYPSPNPAEVTINGFKWFSSATDSDMTLLLAREHDREGKAKEGSKGLSLFYAELRDSKGTLNGIKIVRLKNKYGTKPLPTAELELEGMKARRVGEVGRGVASVSTVLNITRIHAAINVVGMFRRALVIANDFALKREAFGKTLISHPLHASTLYDLEVLLRATTHLTLHVALLLGIDECSSNNREASMLLRLLTPVTKGWASKVGTWGISECMEALGGNGYIEEVGIGALLRDAQVNTIWEGTTNIMSLDVLRVIQPTRGEAYKVFEK